MSVKQLGAVAYVAGLSACIMALLWLLYLGVPDDDTVECSLFFTARCKEMVLAFGGPAALFAYSRVLVWVVWIGLALWVTGLVIEAREPGETREK
jgi:hypothetical protein